MAKNFLFIVEGEIDEKTLFSRVLERYGFNAIVCGEKLDLENVGQLSKLEYSLDTNNIVIIQGPRNRIHDFLKYYNDNCYSVERAFHYEYAYFKGIFLIYDVDHNDCDDVSEMFAKFNDESSGMLLLSSPCIEVLGDYDLDRKEEKYHRINEYKVDLNNYYSSLKTNTIDYIVNNFEKSAIYFIRKNCEDFKENNIMEHPRLVVEWINKFNERVNCENKDESYVIYRYFTTVIYVSIAYINGLTKDIDNAGEVISFFESRLSNK